MLSLEEDKIKAIALREGGASVKGIARELVRSPATISKWVKHVCLSEAQKRNLASLSRGARKHLIATKVNQAKCAALRQSFRDAGRKKAEQGDIVHAMCCALYWAEGTKKRNTLTFCNTDAAMVKMFHGFIVSTFRVAPKVQFSYHEGEGNLSPEDVRSFWASLLGVDTGSVEGFANKDKRIRSGHKKRRHAYGMCVLTVCSTEVVQHIYGALEVYGRVVLVE